MPLLSYMFELALAAHPKSHELLVLYLVFLRFVFRDAHAAVYMEKVARTASSDLQFDLKYTLYAGSQTLAFRRPAGSTVGLIPFE
jgi:hypothetical protein